MLHTHRDPEGNTDRTAEQAGFIAAKSLLLETGAATGANTSSAIRELGRQMGIETASTEATREPLFPSYTDYGSEEMTRVLNRPLELCQEIGARIRAFRVGDDASLMLEEVSDLVQELREVEASPDALREYEEEIALMLRRAGLNLPN